MFVFLICKNRGSLPQSNEQVEKYMYIIGYQRGRLPVFKKPPLWDATSRRLIPILKCTKLVNNV